MQRRLPKSKPRGQGLPPSAGRWSNSSPFVSAVLPFWPEIRRKSRFPAESGLTLPAVPTGELPSTVLARRPDVRATAAAVAARAARLKSLKRDLLPRFNVLIGGADGHVTLAGIPGYGGQAGLIGLQASVPLFTAGRLHARIVGGDADLDAALAMQDRTVLAALEDVEAATSLRHGADQSRAQRERAGLNPIAVLSRPTPCSAPVARRWAMFWKPGSTRCPPPMRSNRPRSRRAPRPSSSTARSAAAGTARERSVQPQQSPDGLDRAGIESDGFGLARFRCSSAVRGHCPIRASE
jgi:hypothetical protein